MITTAKRRELIIDPLCREGASRVEPLSQLLSVSSVTIRINRDVKHTLADASKFGRTSFARSRHRPDPPPGHRQPHSRTLSAGATPFRDRRDYRRPLTEAF